MENKPCLVRWFPVSSLCDPPFQDEPQTVRNAPPVAGAIHWSRQLLKKIEDPMKVFRDNKAVNHSVEFARLVRLYNRLATALVTFESLWFTQWKGQIEQAKSGMNATLLVRHPATGEMSVNADDKYVYSDFLLVYALDFFHCLVKYDIYMNMHCV